MQTGGEKLRFINEEFFADSVTPQQMDALLHNGWRHFGAHFFRYNLGLYEGEIRRVMPLRIRVADFLPSRSLRRILTRNADLTAEISGAVIDEETDELFHRHKLRFKSGVPSSIYDFVARETDVPIALSQLNVRRDGKLVAVSFFDAGEVSMSSIYGFFDTDETRRGLGIFTMLKELAHAAAAGKEFYYHGYAYEGNSFYDYKKRFAALEEFDWRGFWRPVDRAAEL